MPDSPFRSPVTFAGIGAVAIVLLVCLAAMLRGPERRAARVAVAEPSTSGAAPLASAPSARPSAESPLSGLLPRIFDTATPTPSPAATTTAGPSVDDALSRRAMIDTMKTQLRRNDLGGALTTLEKMAKENPEVARDAEAREAIVDLSQRVTALKTDAPSRFFTILSEKMGEPGIDVLYYLVTAKGSSDAAHLAGDILSRPEVAARGSKAMQVAWALRNAKGCEAKRALFARAKDEGDSRTFGQLALLDRQCGRRRRADPSCCLPNDPELKATMAAMRARGIQ